MEGATAAALDDEEGEYTAPAAAVSAAFSSELLAFDFDFDERGEGGEEVEGGEEEEVEEDEVGADEPASCFLRSAAACSAFCSASSSFVFAFALPSPLALSASCHFALSLALYLPRPSSALLPSFVWSAPLCCGRLLTSLTALAAGCCSLALPAPALLLAPALAPAAAPAAAFPLPPAVTLPTSSPGPYFCITLGLWKAWNFFDASVPATLTMTFLPPGWSLRNLVTS